MVLMREPTPPPPSAPHPCRVPSFMAEATPALLGGTEPMTASVAGAITEPMARPRANHHTTITQAASVVVHSAGDDSTTASNTIPTAATFLVPKRAPNRLLLTALDMSPRA